MDPSRRRAIIHFRIALRDVAMLLVLALVSRDARPAEPPAALLWIRNGQPTSQAVEVVDAMRRADEFGLEPGDFAVSLKAIDASQGDAPRRDAALSAAALRLIDQLHDGRIDPLAAGYVLNRHREPIDRAQALQRLAAAADVRAMLASFEPQSAQYRALTRTLARFRRIPADLASLPLPGGRSVKESDRYTGADGLRRLLEEFGDASAANAGVAADLYDADLAGAVARFQQRHGLAADGVLGPRTFAALTVPVASRIRQIELTMERWRWLPDIHGPAVIVNVPQFMLYALPDPARVAASVPASRIPVIVGESVRQTPIFDSAIVSVVFRPFWNIPDSIMREELLPQVARDPAYLARHGMEIVRGAGDDADILPDDAASVAALRAGTARVRQRPGAGNALGLIKFVLPNPYSVYLHASPETQLFSRERRALSHGCIRVSDAAALAAYLLADTEGDWSADRIEAATCGTETFTVKLAKPVPVYILYGTVVIDPDGRALFFDDVYGYDRRLDALLAARRH